MTTMQTVLDRLTGKSIVQELLGVMAENFQDFAQEQSRYLDAMRILQDELGTDISPCAQDDMNAIEQQVASSLFFSGLLGVKANLDNYIDPIARSFLDVDPEIYLREDVAHRLPKYEQAQQVRDRFYASLSPAQKDRYADVISYVSYLQTVGPKLAHYYGYLLGNELLYQVIPGYRPDTAQTIRYRKTLEQYLGQKLPTTVIHRSAHS